MEIEREQASDHPNNTSYRFSLQKIASFAIECCFKRKSTWVYDELLEMINEAMRLFIPASVYSATEKEDRACFIDHELSKIALVSDNIDYKSNNSSYNPKDITVQSYDVNALPNNPKER